MAFKSNAYYGDPTIGAIAGNLGTILFGDPQAELRGAQAKFFKARTADLERKAQSEQAGQAALGRLGDVFSEALYTRDLPGPNIDGSAGVTVQNSPDVVRQRIASRAGDIARAYPEKPGAVAELFSALGAMSGDDGLGRSALIARGHSPSANFATSAARADELAAQAAAEDRALEGVRQAGANRRNAAGIAGENYRKDVQVFDGIDEKTNLPKIRTMGREEYLAIPSATRPQIYVPGVAQVFNTNTRTASGERIATDRNNTTRDVARTRVQGYLDGIGMREAGATGRAGMTLDSREREGDLNRANQAAIVSAQQAGLDTRAANAETGKNGRAALALEGRLAGQRNARIAPKDMQSIDNAVADIAFFDPKDPADKSGPLRDQRRQQALNSLSAAELDEYTVAVSDAFKKSNGNVNAAAKAGVDYLKSRFSLEDKGFISRDMRPTRAPGAASAFSGTPAPAGAPQGVPPPAARVAGQVYETPRGPMQWTGTGWMPAVQQ